MKPRAIFFKNCKAVYILFNLKSLIVRPAVWRVLAALKRNLKHPYWAGLTEYTHLFRFALGYVFGKQSDYPCYRDLQMPPYFKRQV